MAKKDYSTDLVPDDFADATAKIGEPEVANVESVKITNPIPDVPPVVYVKVVNCDKLRVREEPSTDARILALVNKGQKLILISKVDTTWSKIQTLAGIKGYVMNKYIKK